MEYVLCLLELVNTRFEPIHIGDFDKLFLQHCNFVRIKLSIAVFAVFCYKQYFGSLRGHGSSYRIHHFIYIY